MEWHFDMPERMFRTLATHKVVKIHHKTEEEQHWMVLEFSDGGKFAIEDCDLFFSYFKIRPDRRGLLSLTFDGATALDTLHKRQEEWEEEQKEWEEFIRLKAKFEG